MTAEEAADHLTPEDGVFGVSSSIHYQLAIRRALIPPSIPLLQMVVLPSFEPEAGVFVCADRSRAERVVYTGSLATQLWGAASEQCVVPPARPGQPMLFRPPSPEVFERIRPEVRWSSAALSEPTFVALLKAWEAALSSVRSPRESSLGLDGVTWHFVAGHRSGRVWSPQPGSACGALVALGTSLAAFAEAPESVRTVRQDALQRDAQHVAMRFHPDS